jgi:acetyl-CoA synthase
MTPCGMKFTTLAGVMGGGASSPGFVGHSKYNITQGKFILGDGGIKRLVWMPKILKEEIRSGCSSAARRSASPTSSTASPTKPSEPPRRRSSPS